MLSWFEKNYKLSFVIALTIAIIIFYLSSLTFPPALESTPNIKSTLYHFFIFFFLSLFLLISTIKGNHKNLSFIPIIITISIIYGITDELHQFLTPGRATSLSDILTNSLGILLSSLLYSITLVYRNNFTTKYNKK